MSWPHPVPPITDAERLQRLGRLQSALAEARYDGILLGASESLRYFTGLVWHQSERLLGALVTPDALYYIVPAFEAARVDSLPKLPGEVLTWQEEKSPAALIATLLPGAKSVALDPSLPLFIYHSLAQVISPECLIDAAPMIRAQRQQKSPAEIALIQCAMDLTLEVQRRAHGFIREGVLASEMVRFIDDQHRALGAQDGSSFCIVSFGVASSLPHGADGDQTYRPGDVILVDTGCRLDGYHSDLTRTYVLDVPSADFARIWAIERAAQQAVFDAAQIGAACSSLDDAARAVMSRHGLGPDYQLPGLPHRAGHGLGLEIHEDPYLVRGNATKLLPGMCFSNEPMIVVPEKFGIRLEDHIYMTKDGPHWFTEPAVAPDRPFAD